MESITFVLAECSDLQAVSELCYQIHKYLGYSTELTPLTANTPPRLTITGEILDESRIRCTK